MQLVSLVISSVFDLKRSSGYAGKPAHTTFGFSSSSLKKFAVEVPGHPRVQAGDHLIVLLASKDAWSPVLGWVNCSAGELAHADAYGTSVASAVALGASLFLFIHSPFATAATHAIPVVFAAAGLYWTFESIKSHLVKRALRELAASVRSSVGPGTPPCDAPRSTGPATAGHLGPG